MTPKRRSTLTGSWSGAYPGVWSGTFFMTRDDGEHAEAAEERAESLPLARE